jgi:membrane-associated phospholipid phosphatase
MSLAARRWLVPRPYLGITVAAVCAALVAAMGIDFHDKNTGTAFDTHVDNWIRKRSPRLMSDLVHLADPQLVAALFCALIVAAALRRRWDVVLLAAITPLAAVVLNEHILKPWIHRTQATPYIIHLFGYAPLAFPSGHETGIGSFLTVCGLLVLGSRWTRRRKIAVITVFGLIDLVAAIALVGRYYHYATDTIGALLVCISITLLVGLLVDLTLRLLLLRRRQLT